MIQITSTIPADIEKIHAAFEAAGVNKVWHKHTTVAEHVHQFSFENNDALFADAAVRALELLGIPVIRKVLSDPWHPTVTYD